MRRRSRMLAVLGLVAVVLCVIVLMLAPTVGAPGTSKVSGGVGPYLRVGGEVLSIEVADRSDVIDAIGSAVEAGRAWAVRIQVDGRPMTLLVHSPSVDLGLNLDGVGQVIEVGLHRLDEPPSLLVPPGSHPVIPDLSRTLYRVASPVGR